MAQMVREYETKLYEKHLEEVWRFSRKKRRLTRKYYRDHKFSVSGRDTKDGLRIHRALPTGASKNKDHWGEIQEEHHQKELDENQSHIKRNGYHWRQIPSPTSLKLFSQRLSVPAHIRPTPWTFPGRPWPITSPPFLLPLYSYLSEVLPWFHLCLNPFYTCLSLTSDS